MTPSKKEHRLRPFEKFRNELDSCGFKCGWLLQFTQASSDIQHDVQQDVRAQFPLTKEELKLACSKLMETFHISHKAALELEQLTREQSASEKWYASQAGRITACMQQHTTTACH